MKNIHDALHGTIIASNPNDPFGYYAWPTVARTEEGTLWVAASGMRNSHICPWGKSVIFKSCDNGCTWTGPIVVNNSMIDDRDCGLLALPGNRLLLTWFTADTRRIAFVSENIQHILDYRPILGGWTNETVKLELGSFTREMEKDGSWGEKRAVPVSTPHGPILLRSGGWFYFGRNAQGACQGNKGDDTDGLDVFTSSDEGKNWEKIFHLPQPHDNSFYCEPHVLELPGGKLIGMIRQEGGSHPFSILQTESTDQGKSWSLPHFIAKGSPPHLMRHSNGTLICTYGWRDFPGYGQRVMFSKDEGKTWDTNWILRDDAPSDDLGYPSTVELADKSLFTVYYQHPDIQNANSTLMWSRWRLPEE